MTFTFLLLLMNHLELMGESMTKLAFNHHPSIFPVQCKNTGGKKSMRKDQHSFQKSVRSFQYFFVLYSEISPLNYTSHFLDSLVVMQC